MAYRPCAVALGLITFLVAFSQAASAFTIAVSPARVEETLTARPKTRTIKVVNYGQRPTSVAVRVAHFDLDENNKVREIAPTAQSLDQWLIVRPLKMVIAPGKTATIRFAIRPLAKPAPGEHRAMIFLEQQGAKKSESSNQLNVAYRIGIAVYGYASQKKIKSKFHGLSVSKSGLSLDVESVGNSHSRIKGMFGIWPTAKFPGNKKAIAAVSAQMTPAKKHLAIPGTQLSGPLPGYPVLPGYRRKVTNGWQTPLPAGSYRFVAVGSVGELPITKVLRLEIK